MSCAQTVARRYPRKQASHAVLVQRHGDGAREEFGKVRTLGMGGCMFTSRETLGVDSVLDLMMSVRRHMLNARARVVYERPTSGGEFEVGVEFVSMSDADRQMLARMVGWRTSGGS